MATGLMEGYRNTTPTGMEGVGGNAPKEAVVPPMMNEGRAPMGEEMTDGGMTANEAGMKSNRGMQACRSDCEKTQGKDDTITYFSSSFITKLRLRRHS